MRLRPIPNQNERFANMAPDMLQTNQQFLRIDRAIKMAFVDPAADGQRDHRRSLSAKPRDALEHWRLPSRGPGKADRFGVGQSKLIFKDDFGAELLRFFLSAANPVPTRLGSILRPALWPGDPASAHSSPNHATSD